MLLGFYPLSLCIRHFIAGHSGGGLAPALLEPGREDWWAFLEEAVEWEGPGGGGGGQASYCT